MAETILDLEQIKEILPHRYPFLLVDRVIDMEPGVSIRALKSVTYNESFFQGHFPGRPVMPGVLIVEAMAQAGGILVYHSGDVDNSSPIFFMGMDKIKFRRQVVPGDQLIFELEFVHQSSRAWKMSGKALVDGQVAVQGELTAGFQAKPK